MILTWQLLWFKMSRRFKIKHSAKLVKFKLNKLLWVRFSFINILLSMSEHSMCTQSLKLLTQM